MPCRSNLDLKFYIIYYLSTGLFLRIQPIPDPPIINYKVPERHIILDLFILY